MSGTSQSEPEAIASELSRAVGARFKVHEPTAEFPPSASKVDWVVRCVDLANAPKAFHVDAVWKEGQDIFVETRSIGSTSEWVEMDYGEKAAGRVLRMDLTNFDSPEVRGLFGKQFPKVAGRLEMCERLLEEVSSEHHASLRIRYDGGKGLAVFYLQSKSLAGGVDSEIAQIKKSAAALKAAIKEIEKTT